MKLTNTAIDALEEGKTIRDDAVKGLHVINKKGNKGFYMYYRTKLGDERRPKLGVYGIITLAQAREIGREILSEVSKGNDPAADRRKAKNDPTMVDLYDHCAKTIYAKRTTWFEESKRFFRKYVEPHIGKVRVRDVDYSHIDAIHRAQSKAPILANRVVAVMSRMLGEAERLGWRDVGTNPCSIVERNPEKKRKRYARPAEIATIGALLEAKAKTYPAGVAFIYLLMFSGARPSEIAKALPSQIDRVEKGGEVHGILRLHGKTTDNTGHDRVVFLPPQAMRVIDRLPKGRTTITGLARTPKKLWNTIRREAGCEDLWARDWRRTFATVGFSAGENIGMVGELLGHQSAQTTKIYAKLMEDPGLAASARIAAGMEKLLRPSGV